MKIGTAFSYLHRGGYSTVAAYLETPFTYYCGQKINLVTANNIWTVSADRNKMIITEAS